MATAIGLDVEVPHIIRLLAAHLYRARANGDRLELDQSIDLYLDGSPVVPIPVVFAKSWWRVNRDPVTEEVLGPQTIDECLKTHRKCQITIQKEREAEDAAADPGSSLDAPLDLQAMPHPPMPHDLLSRQAVTMLGTMTAACPSCLPNRNAALKAFTKDQKHVRRFKAARDAFQEQRDAAARRAAGFLKLHEAAVAKEFKDIEGYDAQAHAGIRKGTSRRGKGKRRSDTSQQSALVRERAEQELQLSTVQKGDAKWAVGPGLDLDDIRDLLQCGPAGPGA